MIDNLLKLIESGQDSALVRFGLGGAYLRENDAIKAAEHLEKAVEMDVSYSAAWKLLGKAWQAAGRPERAAQAFREGIAVATKKGDVQAAKEMKVFLKRIEQPKS